MMTAPLRPVLSSPSVEFDPQLMRKLDLRAPRYTCYPTKERFTEQFDYGDYLEAIASVRMRGTRQPLSLYLHIPFCDSNCFFCACNKVVTKERARVSTYLGYLKREIEMQGKLFTGMNRLEQLHFGGGTPTYLSDAQMDDLMETLRNWFRFAPDEVGEYSIEVDPRTVTPERVHTLRAQGFNRIRLGVQDFDPSVQKAINRIQPEDQTLAVIEAARSARFRSVSLDLIYGLPKQHVVSMTQTLDKIIAADPDRIALYHYAHFPQIFKSQRRIDNADLPNEQSKLDLLYLCIKRLTEAGYVYIGTDYFAKPGDDLVTAQQQGRLHRSFRGYSTHTEADLIPCGVSAIGAVGATYSQNETTIDAYYERLDQGKLPIARGIKLNMDELLRGIIIQMLMCNFELSIASVELAYPITFASYFAPELKRLRTLQDEGLIEINDKWISVTLKGRLLIRNICAVFDRYLHTVQQDNQEPLP